MNTSPAKRDITGELAAFAVNLTLDDLPPEVIARQGLLLLDTWGIMLRARAESDSTPALCKTIDFLGSSTGPCSTVGDTNSIAATSAALLNGTLAHSLDFDDTHAGGSFHPSATVVPAALAAAELVNADGRILVPAVVAGYEVAARIAMSLPAAAHYERGFHPSATVGAFGAAAAACRVFELSSAAAASAFGIALSHAAGSMQYLANGAWTKRLQVGAAAANGLLAAALARDGFLGAAAALEGDSGFLRSYSNAPEPERLLAGLGETWETMQIGIKPYPSCRFTHAAIDALRRWHGDVDVDDVEAVEIGLTPKAYDIVGSPQQSKRLPGNLVDAQFSVHAMASLALTRGDVTWDGVNSAATDPVVRALSQRISTFVDARAETNPPGLHHNGTTVRLTTRSGKMLEAHVVQPSGEPADFPSPAAVVEKFHNLADPVIGVDAAQTLANALIEPRSISTVRPLFEMSALPARQDHAWRAAL